MKQKFLILSGLCMALHSGLWAQDAVSAAGGEASGNEGTVSYTIGQVVYTTAAGQTGSVCQGVQHAYEIYSVGMPESPDGSSISVFPNPAADQIFIRSSEKSDQNLGFMLFDSQGKLIQTGNLSGEVTPLNTADLPAAIYHLSFNRDEKIIQNFRIVKTNNHKQ